MEVQYIYNTTLYYNKSKELFLLWILDIEKNYWTSSGTLTQDL